MVKTSALIFMLMIHGIITGYSVEERENQYKYFTVIDYAIHSNHKCMLFLFLYIPTLRNIRTLTNRNAHSERNDFEIVKKLIKNLKVISNIHRPST